ncbi:hypothetical protein OBA47_01555 [bacterium]|nr:hypothetical protein [bacterium]
MAKFDATLKPSCDLSQNLLITASQMTSSTEQREEELTNSIRIRAAILLGLGCFSAVVTGGFFVGQTISEALSTFQMVAPVEIDPLR